MAFRSSAFRLQQELIEQAMVVAPRPRLETNPPRVAGKKAKQGRIAEFSLSFFLERIDCGVTFGQNPLLRSRHTA
jgi:hypothetical protein